MCVKELDKAPPSNPADLPSNPARRRIFQAAGAASVVGALPAVADAKIVKGSLDAKLKAHIKNVVVIYLENRSFNNLFADFPGCAAPLSELPAALAAQKDRDGSTLPGPAQDLGCLLYTSD
ncbi:MAG TPA: hypothetical protein DCW29_19705, partial [Janthinobacterium sp.]|nr:hypothetical protein [Janthinobacterium sp.]